MEESRWVREAQKGSVEAFNRLVARYQDDVYQLVSCLLPNGNAAVALTQDIFVQGFRVLAQFRGGSFRGWLLRLALDCARAARASATQPRRSMLTRGLDTLPADLLDAVALVDLCGLTYSQAAEVLNLSAAEVSARLARARVSLSRLAAPRALEYA